MPRFSAASKAKLNTCHPDIQRVMNHVIVGFDIKIIHGHRGQATQNKLFNDGKSKLRYPLCKHNKTPSDAVDIAPYPVDWADEERFVYLAGYVMGLAKMLDVNLRWGGDWDMDTETKDNRFRDLGHFERVSEK